MNRTLDQLRADFPDWRIRSVGAGRWIARHDQHGVESAKGITALRRLLEQYASKSERGQRS